VSGCSAARGREGEREKGERGRGEKKEREKKKREKGRRERGEKEKEKGKKEMEERKEKWERRKSEVGGESEHAPVITAPVGHAQRSRARAERRPQRNGSGMGHRCLEQRKGSRNWGLGFTELNDENYF
jgi:hypothetical protein